MKDEIIVIPVLGVCDEILHCLGCGIGKQTHMDVTLCCTQDGTRAKHLFTFLGSGHGLFFTGGLFIKDITFLLGTGNTKEALGWLYL
jgi:hypothetical protein